MIPFSCVLSSDARAGGDRERGSTSSTQKTRFRFDLTHAPTHTLLFSTPAATCSPILLVITLSHADDLKMHVLGLLDAALPHALRVKQHDC